MLQKPHRGDGTDANGAVDGPESDTLVAAKDSVGSGGSGVLPEAGGVPAARLARVARVTLGRLLGRSSVDVLAAAATRLRWFGEWLDRGCVGGR